MKNRVKMQILAALVLLGAGWWLIACKSAPQLTKDQALTMIQANYAQSQATTFDILVDDRGMQQGVAAKFWAGIKRYPNGYWGDFKLTPDGAKVLKLVSGGDTIKWRPEGPNDPRYAIAIEPLSAVKLEARTDSLGDPQTLGDSRTVAFTEDVNLSALPDALQNIAHNPGNKLTTSRLATFTLDNGAWALKSIN